MYMYIIMYLNWLHRMSRIFLLTGHNFFSGTSPVRSSTEKKCNNGQLEEDSINTETAVPANLTHGSPSRCDVLATEVDDSNNAVPIDVTHDVTCQKLDISSNVSVDSTHDVPCQKTDSSCNVVPIDSTTNKASVSTHHTTALGSDEFKLNKITFSSY